MELFKLQVGNELPIKFSFAGKVYNWISYDGNAALYGILMLGCIHLAALALQISISREFKYNPWIESKLKTGEPVGYVSFSWLESMTWVMLVYFLIHTNGVMNLMLIVNTFHLVGLVVIIFLLKK